MDSKSNLFPSTPEKYTRAQSIISLGGSPSFYSEDDDELADKLLTDGTKVSTNTGHV